MQHRIERIAHRGRLGVLLQALSIRESELRAQLWRRSASSREARWSPAYADPVAGQLPTEDAASDLATRQFATGTRSGDELARSAISQWEAGMRCNARSARLTRDLGITGPMLEQLIDELAAAARRLSLERRIARSLGENRSLAQVQRQEDFFSSCAGAIINGFVERPDPPQRSYGSGPLAVSDQPGSGRGGTMLAAPPGRTAVRPRTLGIQWCDAVTAMVEANAAAEAAAGESNADPELMRLLARMSPDNEEASF